jgi:hypothetical protein
MNSSLTNEPVSTKNSAFTALVEEHIANGEVVVTLIRYSNCGGAKDYLLVRSKDEFAALLKKQISKTSVSVFFEGAFSLKGEANSDLLQKATMLFAKEKEEYEGLDIICLESHAASDDGKNILFLQNLESIEDYLHLHKGHQVLIGTMKFWIENNENVVTSYVPDDDGQVRPGAY